MVALGSQDNLKEAQAFQKRHKMSTTKVLWDSTGKSWDALGVPSQPAWILLNVDGSIKDSSPGEIPYENILSALK